MDFNIANQYPQWYPYVLPRGKYILFLRTLKQIQIKMFRGRLVAVLVTVETD